MAWFLPPASPTVSGLASPHPTSQIKTFDIIAPILMDTQHTSFIQPQFLISHYQFLLIMQPFRKTTTVREVLLTAGAKRGAFLYVFLCVCVCVPGAGENPDPRALSLPGRGRFAARSKAGPRLWLISPSHEEHCRAQNNVHQHKQVASS